MTKDTQIEFYNDFLESLNYYKSNNVIKVLKRGVSKEFAFKNFNLDIKHNSLQQFSERLFYFGEKSKYFWEQKMERQFSINDFGDNVFKFIFKKLNEIAKHSNPKAGTIIFRNKNRIAFDFFDNPNNLTIFLKKSTELEEFEKKQLRNYYFRIIHQLGETDFANFSINISGSENEFVARKFSKNQIIINYWDFDFNHFSIKEDSCPIFIGKPYKNQKEISVFGAIFPQYIYSFKYKNEIYYNPALFKNQDFQITVLTGFDIDQTDFKERLKSETNYEMGISQTENNISEIKI